MAVMPKTIEVEVELKPRTTRGIALSLAVEADRYGEDSDQGVDARILERAQKFLDFLREDS